MLWRMQLFVRAMSLQKTQLKYVEYSQALMAMARANVLDDIYCTLDVCVVD